MPVLLISAKGMPPAVLKWDTAITMFYIYTIQTSKSLSLGYKV